ncbi:hypothetical protein QMO56_21525 [Roseomonas sp. E05]|uniref:hypothetical protein n=1 Tax=Roseomonas sp. E05 TaxID=3046310 RepID=UPI0024B92BA5|nr:hypothetical protein [Roseomonas sp. E05]MDJ0390700.1 hypothetical protein [Roseomonas sp. E05]
MNPSHLSLVVGGAAAPGADHPDTTTPLPGAGTLHLHLHVASEAMERAPGEKGQPLSRWTGLLAGMALVVAFGGGYQLGHRPARDDVSNLRPPALAGFTPPVEAVMPSTAGGLPAIQRELALPPRIIPPQGVAPHAATPPAAQSAPGTPAAVAAGTGPTGPSRNAFGLEN